MCTSITARRHAGFQEGGAFVILTRPGEGGQEAEGEVRIRWSGAEQAGVKIRVSGWSGRCRRGGVEEVGGGASR